MNNVVCIKYGRYYGPEYVNRLFASVARNLTRPFRFVCVTNDVSGIRPEVECVPFMPDRSSPIRSCPYPADISVQSSSGFCSPSLKKKKKFYKRIFRRLPPIGNSSCFRFDAGASNAVYEFFLREVADPAKRHLFTKGSQKLQTRAMFHVGKVAWWPADWVCSFKRQCIPPFPLNLLLAPRPPKAASVVAFHGHPDIPEARGGYAFRVQGQERVRVKPHLTCRPAPWIDGFWHE